MTLREAQRICREVDAKYWMGTTKWNEIFVDENEIIEELKALPIRSEAPAYTYKGYDYIHSFTRRLKSGQNLSEAQMKQAKRLAVEIRKAYLIKELE